MNKIYNCAISEELMLGLRLARKAIAEGELIVLPTDTVYGVAADAFNKDAIGKLFFAKKRDRKFPVPVLVPDFKTVKALALEVPKAARKLADYFWPGALTIVLKVQPSIQWDIGNNFGTVALRIPDNPVALELLHETGPLAVSSANISGYKSAINAQDAMKMLGSNVSVYLDFP